MMENITATTIPSDKDFRLETSQTESVFSFSIKCFESYFVLCFCIEHFQKEDIFTTRNGVRLKENLCPVNKTSGSNVIDDLDF